MNTTIIALGNTSGVPARFNSISEPSDSSIVLPELNSVTEVNCTSEEEVFAVDDFNVLIHKAIRTPARKLAPQSR
jgi:hypothetical protein